MRLNSARFRRLCLVGTGLALLSHTAAFAQETGITPPEDTTQDAPANSGDEIVVTGSRIARDPNAVAPSPIVTVTAADVRATGQNDVTEVLRELPALISSGTIADSIERGAGGVGQATLNLRNLGSNRTLVLVNGRRHVAGVAGTQIVDVATIPNVLIESVDVLTGGASAVYGADAVTGVVNFNLRRDFEGAALNGQAGISEEGDAGIYSIDAAIGKNFAGGRGNVTLAGSYNFSQEMKTAQRDFTRDNRQASAGLTYANPALRFQRGDIVAGSMPNFAGFYSTASRRYPYGYAIPLPGSAAYNAIFTGGRTPTAAEQALIDRARSAPSRAPFLPQPNFAISSGAGLIGRADYAPFRADTDGNGVADCADSYVGQIQFLQNFLGGCLVSTPGGGVRPFRDGLISTTTNQQGGDGSPEAFDDVSLLPQSQRYDINLLTRFEFSPAAEVFLEAKYVRTETRSQPSAPNTFYDQLYVAPDNPFIPAIIRGEAVEAGGLTVSRDFYDIPNLSASDRDTYRIVGGVRGEVAANITYEVSANYGRTENETRGTSVLPDRLFAAIDVINGPNGPRCRSDVDPTPHPGSQYFPVIGPGFFTFTPGDGTCRPANLFNGIRSLSADAVNFITETTTNRARLEQLVIAGYVTGNTGSFFNLPGGAVSFVVGGEYREEKSRSRFDPLILGILPANSPAGPAGTFVGDVDDRLSLTFDGSTRTVNAGGRFDVKEVYGELELPILRDRPFFHDLTVSGAARYSDYSTVGGAFTWNVNGIYAPIPDVRLRGTYAVAIRAPNISELFSPEQGAVFRPIDPCEQSEIDALVAAGDPRGPVRAANCLAAGLPVGFTDPLTARFSGVSGGNPNLREETAKTWTAGAVLQPRFIPGLTISGDYYNIRIDDAIAAVSAQNIVNSCYDSSTFPNQYCDLFTRGPNLGFNFLRQTQLNFGRIETAGVDATIAYDFRFGDNRINLRATGNYVEKINRFFDPADPSVNNPGLREFAAPEWSAVGSASWTNGPFTLGYRLQYIGDQTLAGVEIETFETQYGDVAFAGDTFVHDISFNIEANDRFSFYGGVNNVANARPFVNAAAYPVTSVGRFFFLGARTRF